MVMKTKKKMSLIEAIDAQSKISPYRTSLSALDDASQAEVIDAARHVAKNSLSLLGAWKTVKETYPVLKYTTWETLVRKAKQGDL